MILLAITLGLLLTNCLYVISKYNILPDSIPTHFGLDGKPDNWGKKKSIFLLPMIAIIIFLIMWFAEKYSGLNIPRGLNESSALRMYRHIMVSTQCILFLVSYLQIEVALRKRIGLGKNFIIFFFVLILYPFLFLLF